MGHLVEGGQGDSEHHTRQQEIELPATHSRFALSTGGVEWRMRPHPPSARKNHPLTEVRVVCKVQSCCHLLLLLLLLLSQL
jgi:hypothetical protein